jgi:NADH-quinone oxidoreductase subunit F
MGYPHPSHPKETVVLSQYFGDAEARSYDGWVKRGGYEAFRKALGMTREAIVEEVKASGLRGRGGAGFPTGLKWSFMPKEVVKPHYLVCNADESEPGTFKDREIMEIYPHELIEGVAIGSYAIGGEEAFIYIRGEYTVAADRLEAAIEVATQAGLLGNNVLGTGVTSKIHVFRGAGAYICGEETALLESLEGRRPMPRSRPPFPAVEGLYRRPTCVNNAETLANVPHIVKHGQEWYNSIGVPPRNTGPKIFCVSGRVNKPGNYELPLGAVTFRELIEHYAGGVIDGRPIKGVLPAGISAPIATGDQLDAKLDYDSVAAAGTMLGSASLIVLDDTVPIPWAAARMVEFFRMESCGKCTPCREGTQWMHNALVRIQDGRGRESDLDLLLSVASEVTGKVLCALGDFSTSPVVATIRKFRDE